jgi:hypothetical protein
MLLVSRLVDITEGLPGAIVLGTGVGFDGTLTAIISRGAPRRMRGESKPYLRGPVPPGK